MRALLLFALAGCGAPPKDDSGGGDTGSGRVPAEAFDPSCAGQLMFSQVVGTSGTIEVDWSALRSDSAGAPFDAGDIAIVHWYILGMPTSTLDARLCADGDFSVDVLDGNAAPPPASGSAMTFEIGEEWSYQTGVITLYDTTDELSEAAPRAAAVFTFDAGSTNRQVLFEGRGDVWTAP